MSDLILYGLKNCDTCKKAMRDLEAAGRDMAFINIREDADLRTKVPTWLGAVGAGALVNKRSTTWRELSDADKADAEENPAEPLIANPTLIKRPVIEAGPDICVGWTADVKKRLV